MLGGKKRLEDHLLLLFGHALAGVGQCHSHVAGHRGIDLDRQHATLGHGFQCISKQAIEYLREQHLLADDRWHADRGETHFDVRTLDQGLKGTQGVFEGQHQVDRFTVVIHRPQRHQQFTDPARHAVDLTDDVADVFLCGLAGDVLGQFGAGTDIGQRVAQAVGDRRGHLAKGDKGLVGDQLFLLALQQRRRASHNPEQPQVNGCPADQRGQPDCLEATLDTRHQIHRLLVDFHHGNHFASVGVEHRNVVLDEQVLRFAQQALLGTLLIDFVVTGGHRRFHFEGFVQLKVAFDTHADQLGVGRPDHGAVQGVHRRQQDVRQMLHMVKKLNARGGPGYGVDVGVGIVHARVEHFTHGSPRGNAGMPDFGLANGLDELRGQHRIALDTFIDNKARGDVTQPQRHHSDDQKACQGEPAQQIELRPPTLALCNGSLRRSYFLLFEYLHGCVLGA
ncbi:hypothetical protein D9M71_269220 [compost metagenome]